MILYPSIYGGKRSEYKEYDQDMFIDNLTIRAQSTDTRQLGHLVEII